MDLKYKTSNQKKQGKNDNIKFSLSVALVETNDTKRNETAGFNKSLLHLSGITLVNISVCPTFYF